MAYMPMYNPYTYQQQYQPQMQQPGMLQKNEVVRVSGRGGAEAYQMAPNSSIILLDESAPVIWLKTTDGPDIQP